VSTHATAVDSRSPPADPTFPRRRYLPILGHAASLLSDPLGSLDDWAKERGYSGMQFNAVAASNVDAIAVYERLGFRIVGTVPGAFAHPTLGRVGLHVMFCAF
jgi:hypothetical protein